MELKPQITSSAGETNLVAIIDTGAELTVPPIVQIGNIVRIDTKTCMFAGMAGIRSKGN